MESAVLCLFEECYREAQVAEKTAENIPTFV
jgi:hypothetical protein